MPVLTYAQKFKAGTRVRVVCVDTAGTDLEFEGRTGAVVRFGMFIAVQLDRRVKHWPNPAYISPHNLQVMP